MTPISTVKKPGNSHPTPNPSTHQAIQHQTTATRQKRKFQQKPYHKMVINQLFVHNNYNFLMDRDKLNKLKMMEKVKLLLMSIILKKDKIYPLAISIDSFLLF